MGARNQLMTAREYMNGPIGEDNYRGVYYFFFREGLTLLERSGYFFFEERLPLQVDGAWLLYVGKSCHSIGSRIEDHLRRDCRTSSLRLTIACILADEFRLEPIIKGRSGRVHFGAGEKKITAWIDKTALISRLPCSDPIVAEKQAIHTLAPPFNIAHRAFSGYSKSLSAMRERFGYFSAANQSSHVAPLRLAKEVNRMHLKCLGKTEEKEKRRIGASPFDATQIADVNLRGDRELCASPTTRCPERPDIEAYKDLPAL